MTFFIHPDVTEVKLKGPCFNYGFHNDNNVLISCKTLNVTISSAVIMCSLRGGTLLLPLLEVGTRRLEPRPGEESPYEAGGLWWCRCQAGRGSRLGKHDR